MIPKEAIEAAARAMCEAWHYSKIGTPDGDAEWGRKQDQYRTQARAAITAAFAAMPGPAVKPGVLVADTAPASTHLRGDPVAWRYRHVPTVGWSYSDSKHPREDLEQEPLYGPDAVGLLREALARMENCCEHLAATRSMEVYAAIVDGGQAQGLLDLDNARRNARAALATTGGKP